MTDDNLSWFWDNLADIEKGKIMAKSNRPTDDDLYGAYSPLRIVKRFPNGVEVHWDQEKNIYTVGKPGKMQFETYSKEIALATAEGHVFADGRGDPLNE